MIDGRLDDTVRAGLDLVLAKTCSWRVRAIGKPAFAAPRRQVTPDAGDLSPRGRCSARKHAADIPAAPNSMHITMIW